MICGQARQQNLNCNLDTDNRRSGVGSVECEVRRNPAQSSLEYTRVHSFSRSASQSFSQSVSRFQLQAHGYHMAPFKRFPVGRATLGRNGRKNTKKIQLKAGTGAKKVSRPYRQGGPIVFCGSSIIMTMMQPPRPLPLFPEPRNHHPATFCLICSCADRFLLVFDQVYVGPSTRCLAIKIKIKIKRLTNLACTRQINLWQITQMRRPKSKRKSVQL